MLLFTCGHLGKQLYFVHVLLTDNAIYLLKKGEYFTSVHLRTVAYNQPC